MAVQQRMPVIPTDMKSLTEGLNTIQAGTGDVRSMLHAAVFSPRLPGLTKLISKMSKEGEVDKALEVFYTLPELGITYDTTITNAAISSCDKGAHWQAALDLFYAMPKMGLTADAITYSSVISALAKGRQWKIATAIFKAMQKGGIQADVVTCCSLISALESGGQWALAEILFEQMCMAKTHDGTPILSNYLSYKAKYLQMLAAEEEIKSNSSRSDKENDPLRANMHKVNQPAKVEPRISKGNYADVVKANMVSGSPKGQVLSGPVIPCSLEPQENDFGAILQEKLKKMSLSPHKVSHEEDEKDARKGSKNFISAQRFPDTPSQVSPGSLQATATTGPSPSESLLSGISMADIPPNRICCNAMLAAFSRAKPPQWQKALMLLQAMTESPNSLNPDVVSFNTCIKACGNAHCAMQALEVYKTMLKCGVMPSITTFGSLLTACQTGSVEQIRQIWVWAQESGIEIPSTFIQAYAAALSKRGESKEAQELTQKRTTAPVLPFTMDLPGFIPAAVPLPTNFQIPTPGFQAPGGRIGDPSMQLWQLAQIAKSPYPKDLENLAQQALSAFQEHASFCGSLPSASFVNLLTVLGLANLWDTAFAVYRIVPVAEAMKVETASHAVHQHLSLGNFFWALHIWLATFHQLQTWPHKVSQKLLLQACCNQMGGAEILTLLLNAMLNSQDIPDADVCVSSLVFLTSQSYLLQAANLVVQMGRRGMKFSDPDFLAMLSNLDGSSQDLQIFLQACKACGALKLSRLMSIFYQLSPYSLEIFVLPLLQQFAPDTPGLAESMWVAANRLVQAQKMESAIKLIHWGHTYGTLRNFCPLICDKKLQSPISVDVSGFNTEKSVIIILAWAIDLWERMQKHGIRFDSNILLSKGTHTYAEKDVKDSEAYKAVKAILTGRTENLLMPLPFLLPQSPINPTISQSFKGQFHVHIGSSKLEAWVTKMQGVIAAINPFI